MDGINRMLTKMRSTVSADKNRFTYGDINIDMTYITDRIIAMSFPADGFEATYRNHISDVSFVFSELHRDRYMVYNLTERSYDYSKFENVVAWCGWPDHHSPPLVTLLQLMKSIHDFLSMDPQHVVAIHCLAGKGRTGTAIACYLIYCGLFSEGVHARNYFGYKRSHTNWGVVGPAQIRTVDYMADLVKRGMPIWTPLQLKAIRVNKAPALPMAAGTQTGWEPIISIYEYNAITLPDPQPLIWTNSGNSKHYSAGQQLSISLKDIVIMGDVEIDISHMNWGRRDSVAVIAFNTALLERDNPNLVVRFPKTEIDKAYNDSRFPYDFWIEFEFEKVDPSTPLTVPLHPNAAVGDYFWSTVLERPKKFSEEGSEKLCFIQDHNLQAKLEEAKSFQTKSGDKSYSSSAALVNRGGWLTKFDQSSKAWKRRWFVLHYDKLEYFKKPNSLQPLGHILVSEIEEALPLNKAFEAENLEDIHPNSFTIFTTKSSYLCYADNEVQLSDWVEAITTTVQLWQEALDARKQAAYGIMVLNINAAKDLNKQAMTKSSVDAYAVINYETLYRTTTVNDSLSPVWPRQDMLFYLYSDIPPKLAISLYDEHFLGDSLIGTTLFNLEGFLKRDKPVTIQKWYPLVSPTPDKEREDRQQLQVTLQYFPSKTKPDDPQLTRVLSASDFVLIGESKSPRKKLPPQNSNSTSTKTNPEKAPLPTSSQNQPGNRDAKPEPLEATTLAKPPLPQRRRNSPFGLGDSGTFSLRNSNSSIQQEGPSLSSSGGPIKITTTSPKSSQPEEK